jgi:hypothetical protein
MLNEQGPYSYSVRCAKLRHAEMPKEPRRVPAVVDGFIDGPPCTAPRVGSF